MVNEGASSIKGKLLRQQKYVCGLMGKVQCAKKKGVGLRDKERKRTQKKGTELLEQYP